MAFRPPRARQDSHKKTAARGTASLGALSSRHSSDNDSSPDNLDGFKKTKSDSFLRRTSSQIKEELVEEGHWLVDRNSFQILVGLIVTLNTLTLGLEADHPEWTATWAVTENIFTLLFLIEMILKMYVLSLDYFKDHANWLDCTLVILSILSIWVLPLFSILIGFSLQSMTVLRTLRLLRLVRLLRVFKQFKHLVVVCVGIVDAMKTTFWVACVLFMVVYVFAIFCVGYIGRGEELALYPGYTQDIEEMEAIDTNIREFNPYLRFGSMSTAMLSLYNIAVLSEWPGIIWAIYLKQPWLVPPFIIFMMFVTFGIMNVIIGMIVDSVIENVQELKEEGDARERLAKLATLHRISDLVFSIDENGDGEISFEELEANMDKPGLKELLAQIALPRGCTSEEILRMLDDDGDQKLQHDEFIKSAYRLVDNNSFQRSCMVQLGINHLKTFLNDYRRETSQQLDLLGQKLNRIAEVVLREDSRLESKNNVNSPECETKPSPGLQPPYLLANSGLKVDGQVLCPSDFREELPGVSSSDPERQIYEMIETLRQCDVENFIVIRAAIQECVGNCLEVAQNHVEAATRNAVREAFRKHKGILRRTVNQSSAIRSFCGAEEIGGVPAIATVEESSSASECKEVLESHVDVGRNRPCDGLKHLAVDATCCPVNGLNNNREHHL